jgi:putative membrane protein
MPQEPTPERARDHLANERTFLAWLRTALAVIALGAVLARLASTRTAATSAAVIVVSAGGILTLIYGARRYYRVAADLEEGRFHPARRSPLYITIGAVLATVAVVALLLV